MPSRDFELTAHGESFDAEIVVRDVREREVVDRALSFLLA